jgi:hypothetical protein
MSKKKNDSLDWTAQLVMLRSMTERFGSLHEAQILQLKLWPFTVDPTLDSTKAEVDIEGKRVDFYWGSPCTKINIDSNYQKRIRELDNNVKFLLGGDWIMTIHLNQTLIFPLDTNNAKPKNNKRRNSKKRIDRSRKARRSRR